MDLATRIEEIAAVVIILAGAGIISLSLNRHFYGHYFPWLDLLRRLIKKETRSKAAKQTVLFVLFYVLLVAGIAAILFVDDILHATS